MLSMGLMCPRLLSSWKQDKGCVVRCKLGRERVWDPSKGTLALGKVVGIPVNEREETRHVSLAPTITVLPAQPMEKQSLLYSNIAGREWAAWVPTSQELPGTCGHPRFEYQVPLTHMECSSICRTAVMTISPPSPNSVVPCTQQLLPVPPWSAKPCSTSKMIEVSDTSVPC